MYSSAVMQDSSPPNSAEVPTRLRVNSENIPTLTTIVAESAAPSQVQQEAEDGATPTARVATSSPNTTTISPTTTTETEVTSLTTKQMLRVPPQHCTRIRHCASMKSPPPLTRGIQREDINGIDNARVFLLHNLMTRKECDHYISETEEIVYRDLKGEFDSEYRSNQRVLVASPALADMLYARLLPYLNRSDVIRIRPMCFGNEGAWRPVRLNEMFKFGKYQKREHFGTHIDGPWVPRSDESSIYTVLLYLNDDFLGGRTVFLPESEKEKVDANIQQMRKSEERNAMEEEDMQLHPTFSGSQSSSSSSSSSSPSTLPPHHHTSSSHHTTIFPRCGSALFFTHDTLHAGLPVRRGCKYVLRTELMFQRIDTSSLPKSITQDFNTSPEYKRTMMMYLDSYAKEKEGDVKGFTNSYLEALKLQHQAQLSVSASTHTIHQLNLPVVLYIHIFSFLPLPDLISSLKVNHAFKDIARDGSLWKCMYQVRYGQLVGEVQSMMNGVARRRKGEQGKEENQGKKEQTRTVVATTTSSSSPAPSTSSPSSSSLSSSTQLTSTTASSLEMEWIPESQLKSTTNKSSSTSTPFPTSLSSRVSVGFNRPIDPSVQDWMTIFRQRFTIESDFSPVCFDLGSSMTKCAAFKTGAKGMKKEGSEFSTSPSSTLPPPIEIFTLVARIPGHFHMHMRTTHWERSAVGTHALMYNPQHILYPVTQGKMTDISLIPEMFAASYLRLGLESYQHPVVLAEPPFSWSSSHKRQLCRQLFSIFHVPSVCFVNSALLVLLSQRILSGIVVNVGAETVWIASVYQGSMIECVDLTSEFTSPNLKFNTVNANRRTSLHVDGVRTMDPRYGQLTTAAAKEEEKESEKLETKHVQSSRLAKIAQDVYYRMIEHISSSSSSPASATNNDPSLTTLHHVVLTGGITVNETFRREFREAVRVVNQERLSNPPRIAAQSSSSSFYHQDLHVATSSSSTSNPLHDTIEGARIFSSLSMFRQHCIQAFEIRVSGSSSASASPSNSSWSSFGDKLKSIFSSSSSSSASSSSAFLTPSQSYLTQEALELSIIKYYTTKWHANEWLLRFNVFWTIRKNFHWEWCRGENGDPENVKSGEDTHLLLVSNFPSSEEELKRLLSKPQQNSIGFVYSHSMSPESQHIRIVWRRNCMTTEENVKKAKVWNKWNGKKRKEYLNTVGNDSSPLHRSRRSPYAVLPRAVARWYSDFSLCLRLRDDIQQQEQNRLLFLEYPSQPTGCVSDTWCAVKDDILHRRNWDTTDAGVMRALTTIRQFEYLNGTSLIEEWPSEKMKKEWKEGKKMLERVYDADKVEEELELDEEEFVPEK